MEVIINIRFFFRKFYEIVILNEVKDPAQGLLEILRVAQNDTGRVPLLLSLLQCGYDLFLELFGQFGIVGKELLHGIAALSELGLTVGEP